MAAINASILASLSHPLSMGVPADSAMTSLDKDAVIKSVDMSEDMKYQAIEVAKEALTEQTVEKDVAAHIKKRFDTLYGQTWHCIVGRSFGSFVTHEAGHFIYFYMRPSKQAFLLFKAG